MSEINGGKRQEGSGEQNLHREAILDQVTKSNRKRLNANVALLGSMRYNSWSGCRWK